MSHRRLARKQMIAVSAAAFGAPSIGAFLGTAASAAEFTLRLSIITPPGSTYQLHAQSFADAVERRSNGRVHVEVYPNGQLAKEFESIAGLTTGTVDLSLHDSSFLTSVFAPAQVMILPFMFKDVGSLYRTVDGPIGTQLFSQLEAKGIYGLSWGAGSFRTMDTATQPITKTGDMKGLRFRIHGGSDAAMMQALSAVPVTIDYSELFTALSQHTVDGLEVAAESVLSGKLYPVIKHVAYTNHVVSLAPLLMSKKRMDALPPDVQGIVREQALAVRPGWRALSVKRTQEAVDQLKANGVTFTDVEYAPFRKAMDPVYTSYESKLGADLIQRVSRAAGAA